MKRPVKKEVYKPTAEQIGNGAYYRLKEIKGYNEAIAEYEAFLTSLQEIKNTTEHAIRNAIRVGFMTSPLMTLQECENKMLPEILKLLTTNDVEYTTVEEGKEEKKTVEEDKELIQAGKDGERLAEECLRKAEEQLKKQLKKEEKNSCESCGFDSSNCAQIDTQDCKYWKSKENSPEVDWEGLKLYLCSDNVAHQLRALINLVEIVKSIHERVRG